MRATLVARLHQQLRVRAHEWNRHRHLHAVRQHEVRSVAELLDDAEDVVPAPRVQPARVIAQLVEDLLHLERRKDGFDKDGGADRSARYTQRILRKVENVVPQPRLEMALELGQIEVRAAALPKQPLRVVKEVQTEIEQASRNRSTANEHVPLIEMPSARPHQKRRDLFIQAVFLALGTGERQPSLDRIDQVDLALDEVRPRRGVGIFEIGHAPVLQIVRGRRDAPFGRSHRRGRWQEVRHLPRIDPRLPLITRGKQLLTAATEFALQATDEVERLRRQHFARPPRHRAFDLYLLSRGHPRPMYTTPARSRTAASRRAQMLRQHRRERLQKRNRTALDGP